MSKNLKIEKARPRKLKRHTIEEKTYPNEQSSNGFHSIGGDLGETHCEGSFKTNLQLILK